MNWEKFDNEITDLAGFKEDIKNADTNEGEYKEVPASTYEVSVEKMELKESKSGKPMLTVWFKILAGEYKNCLLFLNQVITQPFQISITNKLLESLSPSTNVDFESYSQYAELIDEIFENIQEKYEYGIDYKIKNGFGNYKVVEVFDN